MSTDGELRQDAAANLVIQATSDLFLATLLSAPKNEPILRGAINAVPPKVSGKLHAIHDLRHTSPANRYGTGLPDTHRI